MSTEHPREFTLQELNGPKNVVGYPDKTCPKDLLKPSVEENPIILQKPTPEHHKNQHHKHKHK